MLPYKVDFPYSTDFTVGARADIAIYPFPGIFVDLSTRTEFPDSRIRRLAHATDLPISTDDH